MPAQNTKYHILNTGFTLIELLVVISIIGILATLMIANLNSARSRARDAERKSDIRNISTALRLYYNDHGSFPLATDIPWGNPWPNGDTVYMTKVPNDPQYNSNDSTSPTYQYVLGSGGDTFTLSACLENNSDGQGVLIAGGVTCPTADTKMFQIQQ